MKIRFFPLLCMALLCAAAFMPPAMAAEQTVHYPVSVEEYMEGDAQRIKKTYELSPEDDPSGIATGDFERDGRLYYLLDIIRTEDMGVDVQTHTETVTFDSDTGALSEVLKRLDSEMEFATEDGHTGALALDHTSVTVEAKGYKTSTRSLSATRTYPSLSDADLSLIPKTIEDSGKTLDLADVQWTEDGDTYTATASYAGTASSSYATGYTVTASYSGEVTKTECDAVIYTAIFGSMEIPQEEAEETEPEPQAPPAVSDDSNTTRLLVIAGLCGGLLILIPIYLKSAKGKKQNA